MSATFSPDSAPEAPLFARATEGAARYTRIVPWLSASLPLAYYVAAASSDGGYGEEGSFVAAARDFRVPYPPGAPLSALLGALFALLPMGPLTFRVSLASALCAALALALFSRALMSTLDHVGVDNPKLVAGLGLLGSWYLAQSPLFFQQAIRPQVFALQFALSMLVIAALLRFEASEPHGSTRTLYFGAFVQGLCFANHHVYALLLLPLAAPTLGRVFAYRGFIGLMGHVAAPMLAFSAYIVVPLRLGAESYGLSEQGGLKRMLSMLSAEPYWGPLFREPVPALSAVRAGLIREGATPVVLVACLVVVGLWVTLRSSIRRRFGLLWLLAMVLPVLSVSLVLQPRLTEDAWGALLPSACAVVTFAVSGLGVLLTALARFAPRVSELAVALLLVASASAFVLRDTQPAAAEAVLSDTLDDLTRRDLAPGALVLADDASTWFRHAGREAEEALRPDVTLIPLSLRTLPRVVDAWAAAEPALRDTLRDLVLTGRLATGSLQSLSARRPVYVELSEELPREVFVTALDEGLYARVLPDGVTEGDLRSERAAQAVRLGQLYHVRRDWGEVSADAGHVLGRAHLFQALLRLSLHDTEGARDYTTLSLLQSQDARAQRLRRELDEPSSVELDSYLDAPALGE